MRTNSKKKLISEFCLKNDLQLEIKLKYNIVNIIMVVLALISLKSKLM